jgi:tetratricopeptide (TPR) repeat protein
MKAEFRHIAFFLITFVVASCSTEKNTLINRSYHNMTAHYNGYFNANVLIDEALESYRFKAIEDYHLILTLDQFPPAENVPEMIPSIDTAISKCTRVIVKHSMPSIAKVTTKSNEYCRWIDDNWFVIGYANYLKRDYPQAIEKFTFVVDSYNGQKSVHIARIFLARSYTAMGDYRAAASTLKMVNSSIESTAAAKDGDSGDTKKKKLSKFQKKKAKEQEEVDKQDEPAPFPKKWLVDYQIAMAELFIAQKEYKTAIDHVEEALKVCKDGKRKARYMFVLAQLYREVENGQMAHYYFNKVTHSRAPYVMQFQASINEALAAPGGDLSVLKALDKLLRDPKNVEYKDQIYYALGEISMNAGKRAEAKEYYTASALWSVKNNRQKGQSYLRLGDICFEEKNYVHAQKYYDSCVKALPKEFEGYEQIKAKAEGLTDLVFHYEVVTLEDSVQTLGAMDEKALDKYLTDLLKKMREDEQKRKADEAARLLAMQSKVNNPDGGSGSGSKFYFYNPKVKSAGFNDFRAMWGQRAAEDDWRRSNKTTHAAFDPNDPNAGDSAVVEKNIDSLTIDDLKKNIPVTDEDIAASNDRLLNSMYMLGIIYKEQLKEIDEAVSYFGKVVDRKIEHPKVLPSLFQLYLIAREKSGGGEEYKAAILRDYPDSEIAQILRDPEYIKRKEEKEKADLNKYAETFEKYRFNKFQEVQAICEDVIANDTANQFIRKYYLLSAYCLSHLQNGNEEAISKPLIALIEKAPKSEEADQAKIFLGKMRSGGALINNNSDLAPNYIIDNNAGHYFVVVIQSDDPSTIQKTKLSNFNNTFFGGKSYEIIASPLGAGKQMLRVKTFANAAEGKTYIDTYKSAAAEAMLGTMAADYDCFLINTANFKELMSKQDHIAYMDFFKQNY